MAIKPLILPRHTTKAGIDAVTLSAGEVRVDQTSKELRLGDGATAGGLALNTWRRVASQSYTAQAQADFLLPASITDLFDDFELEVDMSVATSDTSLLLRVGTGATPTYQSTGYSYSGRMFGISAGSDVGTGIDAYSAAIPLSRINSATNGIHNGAGCSCRSRVKFSDPTDTARFRSFEATSRWDRPDSNVMGYYVAGKYGSSVAITALRVIPASGTLTGRLVLMGRRRQ